MKENGATSQHPCSPSFRLSALVRDSQVSLNFNKGDLFKNPSGCQRNSPFPHHRSTPGKLQKQSKYHWLPQRGGGGSSVVVGLFRSGRKGQKKRASLSSNRDINKDLQAARNLALKPCKTTWSERAYCLLGYKSIELDSSRRPLCSLQRSTVPEIQSSASAFPVWRMGVRQWYAQGQCFRAAMGSTSWASIHTSSHSSDKWRAPTTYRHYARYQRIRQEWNKFATCLSGVQNLSVKNRHESN